MNTSQTSSRSAANRGGMMSTIWRVALPPPRISNPQSSGRDHLAPRPTGLRAGARPSASSVCARPRRRETRCAVADRWRAGSRRRRRDADRAWPIRGPRDRTRCGSGRASRHEAAFLTPVSPVHGLPARRAAPRSCTYRHPARDAWSPRPRCPCDCAAGGDDRNSTRAPIREARVLSHYHSTLSG